MYLGEIVRAMELYGYKYKSLYESESLNESLDDTVYRVAFEDLYEAIGMLSAELETYVDTKANDDFNEGDEELFNKEEDVDWAELNRSVMSDLLKQYQPHSMKE